MSFSSAIYARRSTPADAQAATQSPSRQHHLRCSDAPSRTASAGPSHWLSPPRRAANHPAAARYPTGALGIHVSILDLHGKRSQFRRRSLQARVHQQLSPHQCRHPIEPRVHSELGVPQRFGNPCRRSSVTMSRRWYHAHAARRDCPRRARTHRRQTTISRLRPRRAEGRRAMWPEIRCSFAISSGCPLP